MGITLEIAVFNVEAALAAIAAGADRIEFCENPNEGGTTPSFGSLHTLIKETTKPVFPIIRPRGGDFLYSEYEFATMKEDIIMAKELGYPGAVIGLLKKDGNIDIERTAELVSLAGTMEITFHRAFDRCIDPMKGLEDIIQTGCKRILTSGQVPNATNALPLLKELVIAANHRIIIMPGSGVRANNIKEIVHQTKATEIHSSARKSFPSKMNFIQETMKEELVFTGVDMEEIAQMKTALH
jgi:copper homeostasis protein